MLVGNKVDKVPVKTDFKSCQHGSDAQLLCYANWIWFLVPPFIFIQFTAL
jgi:hypothetical protein